MKKITRDMTFGELLSDNPEAGMKLAERGLFCGGCPMAQFETIENGALAHGVDVVQLLRELNEDGENSTQMNADERRLNEEGSKFGISDNSVSLEVEDGK